MEELTDLTRRKTTAQQQECKEFHLLKPICAEILRKPTHSNLKALTKALISVPNIDSQAADFVIFPLAVHMKNITRYRESVRIDILNCLSNIFAKCEVQSFDLFIELFQRLNVCLGSAEKPTDLNSKLSEDELQAIISSLLALLRGSLVKHFEILYGDNKVKAVGHSIFMLLQLINHDTVKTTRLLGMDALEFIIVCCYEKQSACHRMFNFLPGIVTSLRHSCSSKVGRAQKEIITKAVNLMKITVDVCISFESSENLFQPDQNLSHVFGTISEDLLLHEEVILRIALLDFSIGLVPALIGKLPCCLDILLNNLLILQSDSEPLITEKCTPFLRTITLINICNFENILNFTKRGIVLLKSGNDVGCLLVLRRVASTLEMTRINFTELRSYLPVIFSLLDHLILGGNAVERECQRSSDPVYRVCVKVCQNILIAASLDDILDEFVSLYSQFSHDGSGEELNCIGMVFCFNEILQAYHTEAIVNGRCDTFCRKLGALEVINLATLHVSILDKGSTEVALMAVDLQKPKLRSALEVRKAHVLRGMGIVSIICPVYVLPEVLYSLIENAGLSETPIISTAALQALQEIASNVPESYNTISDFLRENIDLIMSELGVRILNLSLYPQCPNALIFLAKYFDFGKSGFVDLIHQIFDQSCDAFYGQNMQIMHVKIFFAFMLSLSLHQQKQIGIESESAKDVQKTQQSRSSSNSTKHSLYQRIVSYQISVGIVSDIDHPFEENDVLTEITNPDNKSVSDIPTTNESENETNDDTNDEQVDEPPLSSELNLALRISHRVLNFLPNSEREVKLLAIDCLIKGVILLKSYENSLLPLSHTIWQNLVPRLCEKDYVVVRKSFDLLLALCTASGTFLKKRTLEEVFPKLSSLLMTLATDSGQVKNKNRQYYTYTQAYKLQLTVLQGMGQLCEAIDVQEEDLSRIVDGCLIYMDPKQHKNLRDTARQLLNSVASLPHCRTIWMQLVVNGFRDFPIEIPHPSFIPIPQELRDKQRKTGKKA